ncbi:FAD-dependent monooxygenase [Corticibacterium sp. UT-5YL-CI-8]|nr:FAD-dependent monooxygenase [Tianweitania sp. UT-5YL-CI-8]
MDIQAPSILVVGAGPVGLTLASELARHGVSVRIIEKDSAPLPYCRAIGVTPRTLEVFEDMGIAREIIDSGLWLKGTRSIVNGGPPQDSRPDLSDLTYSQLGVPQYATEAVLTAHLESFGVTVERGVTLAALELSEDGVDVTIDTPQGREAAGFRYVVGCDGAHSAVRHALAIPFQGDAFPFEFMLGDVHIDWDLPRGLAMRALKLREEAAPDMFIAIPLPGRGRYRVTMPAPDRLSAGASGSGTSHGIQVDRPGATLDDLQEVADRLIPGVATLSDMHWSSIFRISMRLAESYRSGNAFIAGDACHIHPPTGGQGMNTGIQDAYNLAWKLALVTRRVAKPALLDSYQAERRPVAADVVVRTTEQSVNLGRPIIPPHRLQDTQLLVSYRDGPLAMGNAVGEIAAGDRVPDVLGLRRDGVGFPLRLFDLLKGPAFVLIVSLGSSEDAAKIEACAAHLHQRWPGLVRVVAIASNDIVADEPPNVELIRDVDGRFATTFGQAAGAAWLIRPDNYIGLAVDDWSEAIIVAYLSDVIGVIDGV